MAEVETGYLGSEGGKTFLLIIYGQTVKHLGIGEEMKKAKLSRPSSIFHENV